MDSKEPSLEKDLYDALDSLFLWAQATSEPLKSQRRSFVFTFAKKILSKYAARTKGEWYEEETEELSVEDWAKDVCACKSGRPEFELGIMTKKVIDACYEVKKYRLTSKTIYLDASTFGKDFPIEYFKRHIRAMDCAVEVERPSAVYTLKITKENLPKRASKTIRIVK